MSGKSVQFACYANKTVTTHLFYIIFPFCKDLIPSVGGVMVSIDAFQALDPGSIPGHRTLFVISKVIFCVNCSVKYICEIKV
jgi:hypothetical protein